MSRWAALSWPARLVASGTAGVALGAAAVLVAGGRNRNDVPGASAIVLALAVMAGAAWWAARRGDERTPLAHLALGAGLAALALTGLELLESARAAFATDRLGLLGLAGRLVAFLAAIPLVLGMAGVARPARRPAVRWLAAVGAVAIFVGWSVLVGLADGFAMRLTDALGISAATGSAAMLLGEERLTRAAGIGLAMVAAFIGIDVLLAVAPHLAGIAEEGPTPFVGLSCYVGGVAAVVAGASLALRDLLGTSIGPESAGEA